MDDEIQLVPTNRRTEAINCALALYSYYNKPPPAEKFMEFVCDIFAFLVEDDITISTKDNIVNVVFGNKDD